MITLHIHPEGGNRCKQMVVKDIGSGDDEGGVGRRVGIRWGRGYGVEGYGGRCINLGEGHGLWVNVLLP